MHKVTTHKCRSREQYPNEARPTFVLLTVSMSFALFSFTVTYRGRRFCFVFPEVTKHARLVSEGHLINLETVLFFLLPFESAACTRHNTECFIILTKIISR